MIQIIILVLVALNTVTNGYIIYKMAAKAWNLSFQWRESFWLRRRYGFDVYRWTYPVDANVPLNEAVSVFGFNFASPINSRDDYRIHEERKTAGQRDTVKAGKDGK